MDSRQKNSDGEEDQLTDGLGVSVAPREKKEKGEKGEEPCALLRSADKGKPHAGMHEVPTNALRRQAERRQTSDLIAWWGKADRRSGEDRRPSPSDKDTQRD